MHFFHSECPALGEETATMQAHAMPRRYVQITLFQVHGKCQTSQCASPLFMNLRKDVPCCTVRTWCVRFLLPGPGLGATCMKLLSCMPPTTGNPLVTLLLYSWLQEGKPHAGS